MSVSSTTYYSALRTAALTVMPTGYLSTWDQSVAGYAGSGSLSMDATSAATVLAGQRSFQNTFSSVTTGNNQNLGIAQFVSSPLTAQTVATAGTTTWNFRFAAQMSNAAANFTWTPKAALYLVNGSTGAIRTTIVALASIGGANNASPVARSATGELSVQGTAIATANTATATAGDYLVWEWGVNVNNTSGGSLSPNVTIFSDGITAIAADNASVSNAASDLICSAAFVTTPIVLRSQIALPPALQPRGPGGVRTQIPLPSAEQTRGPGGVRTQLPLPINQQPRSADVDNVLMRGFDSALNRIVFWQSAGIDPTGAQYTAGSPTNLSDIVAVILTNAKT